MGLFDSPTHLLIILVVLVVLFGSAKLPKAAKSMGEAMRIFKKESAKLHEDDAASAQIQASQVQQGIAAPQQQVYTQQVPGQQPVYQQVPGQQPVYTQQVPGQQPMMQQPMMAQPQVMQPQVVQPQMAPQPTVIQPETQTNQPS